MSQADDFFSPWEHQISDWTTAWSEIEGVIEKSGSRRELAWRGVATASYSLHSSLFRRLKDKLGKIPDETDLVKMEELILRAARTRWRFDNFTALEIFAHLQHYGGPTRLLDVSLNPMVALWFAVEQKYDGKGQPKKETDGRLYIFDVTQRSISLDHSWGGYELPWHSAPSDTWRRGLPNLWKPPSYNDRIPAQNSAFLVGGVPQVYSGGNAKYRKAPGDGVTAGTWSIDEVREATSVTLRMNSLDIRPRGGATPTFTLRVKAEAKSAIRARLEQSFGFNSASIYPDLFGLATYGVNGIL